jgi:putative ABC transport system permease protein
VIGWLSLSLRRLGDARAPALALVLFVLVTSFVAAAAPRALDRAADTAFRQELGEARSSARNLALLREDRIPAGDLDPWSAVAALGGALEAKMPAAVSGLIASRKLMVTTPRFTPESGTGGDQTVRLRLQPGAADRVRVLSGRLPAGGTAAAGDDPATIEIALSRDASIALGLGLGSSRGIRSDRTDPLADRRDARLRVEVVGLFEVIDPADPFWYDDRTLWEPTQRSISPERTFQDVTALAADAAYPILIGGTEKAALPLRTAFRSTIDPARLEVEQLADIMEGLRRMESVFPASDAAGGPQGTTLRTELLGVLTAFGHRWSAAEAVLSVMATGVIVVAGAALALVALLLARRRRAAVGMWRWRGASRLQVDATLLAEGTLLAVPAAASGAIVAIALAPAGPDGASMAAAALVAVIAVGSLVLAIPSTLVGPPHEQARDGDLPRATRPRRIAAEIVIIVLALAGALLLRDRGLTGGGLAGGGVAGGGVPGGTVVVDPFIAAVPALLGAAVGLLTVRLFRIPLRVLAAAAARRRDLVPSLALRRVTRGGTSGPVLLVLLATVSVATFASVMLATLGAASQAAAWGQVGAPFRVTRDGEPLPDALALEPLPGVEASAGAWRAPTVIRQLGVQVEVVALDTAAWQEVVADTPIASALPPAMATTVTEPLPVIVSRALATGATPIEAGDRFPLTVSGGVVQVEVVEVRDAFPSLRAGSRFLLISRQGMDAIEPGLVDPTMERYLRAPREAAPGLRAAVDERVTGATLLGQAETAETIAASPVVSVVTAGLFVATAVAGIYAALAVTAALVLTGAARAIEVARLRALGLSRRGALGLDVIEHTPIVMVAFVVGLALGLGTFTLLRPGLGVDRIVGWPTDVGVALEPVHLLAILVAVGAIVIVGILLAARLAGRVSPAAALRRAAE